MMAKLPHPATTTEPIFIAGPTAVGKSAVALALAERVGGEIISVDSMQVYRGLNIGTAKPTAEEQRRVRHHLINVCELSESFDAAQFVRRAQAAVTEIQARGHVPIFCGGTGLYFQAYLGGLGEAPATDAKVRTELEVMPLEDLLTELRQRDPETFEKIDRQNPRRVVRALEVIRLTGRKFSEQRAGWGKEEGTSVRPPMKKEGRAFVCFTRPAEEMHQRINARVDEMFARGLVAETRELLNHGLAENKFAMQAIGYRQVVEHLRGERDLKETIELVKTKTRQFAKRQLTWFKRYGECDWVGLGANDPVSEVVERLVKRE
jgi:tRNA dimethylallyltransferase